MMARPRKNAAASRASLLPESAPLPEIPVREQPYPLPEGWKWVRLVSTFSTHTDSKKKLPQKEYLSTGTFPVVDQGKEIIGGYTENKSLLYDGPLPVIIFGDHTRCVKFINFYFVQGADGVKVLHAKNFIEHKFLYYSLKNIDMPHLGYRRHFPLFKKFMISLPPIDEQQRIVDCIESLFAKLDEARQKAEAVRDSVALRRAAILHKAFTGELTAKWREEQGYSCHEWEIKLFADIVLTSRLGLVRSKAEQGNCFSYKYLKMNNISSDGQLSLDDLTTVEASQQELDLFKLEYGDFLFNTRNSFELVGKSTVFNCSDNNMLFNNNIMKIQFVDYVNPFYINYFFNSPKGKYQLDKFKKNTTNIAAIYAKDLNMMQIPLPQLPEQREIVRILADLLGREQRIREATDAVVAHIERMKKAILARAFRGELGRADCPSRP